MTLVNFCSGLFALFFFTISYCTAQPNKIIRNSIAEVINKHLDGYGFSSDNLLRLAVYTELKGQYQAAHRQILLDFGDIGKISFYEDNCLIRAGGATLNLNKDGNIHTDQANEVVGELLEKLMLFSNHQADEAHIRSVDRMLLRKNIEPFHKIFTRHVLLRYGKYQAADSSILFHTDYIKPGDDVNANLIQKHKTPLRLILNKDGLRGYYLRTGGEVYVNDSKQKLWYATSEATQYNNITAYKLFIQSLLTETIPYVSQEETYRQRSIRHIEDAMHAADVKISAPSRYQKDEWIGQMLHTLRTNGVSPTEPYILKHLSRQAYFSKVYEQMTDEEQDAADAYQSFGWYLKGK